MFTFEYRVQDLGGDHGFRQVVYQFRTVFFGCRFGHFHRDEFFRQIGYGCCHIDFFHDFMFLGFTILISSVSLNT